MMETQDVDYIPPDVVGKFNLEDARRDRDNPVGYLTVEGREEPIYKEKTTIGRDPTSDIFIDAPQISRLHATVKVNQKKNSAFICVYGKNNYLNGDELDPELFYQVNDGAKIDLRSIKINFKVNNNPEATVDEDSGSENGDLLEDKENHDNTMQNESIVMETPHSEPDAAEDDEEVADSQCTQFDEEPQSSPLAPDEQDEPSVDEEPVEQSIEAEPEEAPAEEELEEAPTEEEPEETPVEEEPAEEEPDSNPFIDSNSQIEVSPVPPRGGGFRLQRLPSFESQEQEISEMETQAVDAPFPAPMRATPNETFKVPAIGSGKAAAKSPEEPDDQTVLPEESQDSNLQLRVSLEETQPPLVINLDTQSQDQPPPQPARNVSKVRKTLEYRDQREEPNAPSTSSSKKDQAEKPAEKRRTKDGYTINVIESDTDEEPDEPNTSTRKKDEGQKPGEKRRTEDGYTINVIESDTDEEPEMPPTSKPKKQVEEKPVEPEKEKPASPVKSTKDEEKPEEPSSPAEEKHTEPKEPPASSTPRAPAAVDEEPAPQVDKIDESTVLEESSDGIVEASDDEEPSVSKKFLVKNTQDMSTDESKGNISTGVVTESQVDEPEEDDWQDSYDTNVTAVEVVKAATEKAAAEELAQDEEEPNLEAEKVDKEPEKVFEEVEKEQDSPEIFHDSFDKTPAKTPAKTPVKEKPAESSRRPKRFSKLSLRWSSRKNTETDSTSGTQTDGESDINTSQTEPEETPSVPEPKTRVTEDTQTADEDSLAINTLEFYIDQPDSAQVEPSDDDRSDSPETPVRVSWVPEPCETDEEAKQSPEKKETAAEEKSPEKEEPPVTKEATPPLKKTSKAKKPPKTKEPAKEKKPPTAKEAFKAKEIPKAKETPIAQEPPKVQSRQIIERERSRSPEISIAEEVKMSPRLSKVEAFGKMISPRSPRAKPIASPAIFERPKPPTPKLQEETKVDKPAPRRGRGRGPQKSTDDSSMSESDVKPAIEVRQNRRKSKLVPKVAIEPELEPSESAKESESETEPKKRGRGRSRKQPKVEEEVSSRKRLADEDESVAEEPPAVSPRKNRRKDSGTEESSASEQKKPKGRGRGKKPVEETVTPDAVAKTSPQKRSASVAEPEAPAPEPVPEEPEVGAGGRPKRRRTLARKLQEAMEVEKTWVSPRRRAPSKEETKKASEVKKEKPAPKVNPPKEQSAPTRGRRSRMPAAVKDTAPEKAEESVAEVEGSVAEVEEPVAKVTRGRRAAKTETEKPAAPTKAAKTESPAPKPAAAKGTRESRRDTFAAKKKTTRGRNSASSSCASSSDSQSRTRIKTVVFFSGFENSLDKETELIQKFGGMVKEVFPEVKHKGEEYVLVVNGSFKRTLKMLDALCFGCPIVTKEWLKACEKSNSFVDAWNFILQDKAAEKKFGFNLRECLTKVQQGTKVFENWNIHFTTNVNPRGAFLKKDIMALGGKFIPTKSKSWPSSNLMVISCDEDAKIYKSIMKETKNSKDVIFMTVQGLFECMQQQKIPPLDQFFLK